MSLSRKFLTAMGIDAEKIDEIITAHTETVEGLKEEVSKYKAEAKDLEDTKKTLEATQKELGELKKTVENNEFESKYNDLKTEFETFKTNIETKAVKAKKAMAYKELLKEAGVSEKRFDAIAKISGEDIDKLEFDDNGSVKDKDNVIKGITENWSEFIQTKHTKGANVETPPIHNAGEEGRKVSRAAKIAQQYHEDLYGKSKEE